VIRHLRFRVENKSGTFFLFFRFRVENKSGTFFAADTFFLNISLL